MLNDIRRAGKRSAGIILFLSCLIIGGCSGGGTETGNPAIFSMSTFSSNAEMEGYLKDQYAVSVLDKGIAYGTVGGNPQPPDEDGGGDFSQTNIQESGVDESDKVKTDGIYLYVAGEQTVTVVDAALSGAMQIISRIDVRGRVDSLHLHNDILVILYTPDGGDGTRWSNADTDGIDGRIGMPYWIPVNARTGILLMDVTDPYEPGRVEEVVADGMLVSSRLISGKLHVIQQFLPDLPSLKLRYDGSEEALAETILSNRQNLEPLRIDDLIPFYEIADDQGEFVESGQLVAPENMYRPEESGGGSVVTVMTFLLDDPSRSFRSIGIVADADITYASARALYLTAAQWNPSEGGEDWREETVIHKFDLTGESVRCMGNGHVPGRILNQFSLGEYEDVLRIATTGNIRSSLRGEINIKNVRDDTPQLSNHLFCLQANDGELKIIGSLENIAPGEKIYAARFVESRGYLVTFVKVDPLFTLDLSDPTDPKVVGELKIPGYSDYIHPFGEDHLLTIGKHTEIQDGTAWFQGVQLSIFDVSDFASPELLYKERIGVRGTESEALYDHKAFTFWEENGLLAIPVDLYEYETAPNYLSRSGIHTFTGLYVYRVTSENGFEFLGRIRTASGFSYYHSERWLRGVFIDESVYAVTHNTVRSADTEDIEATVNTLSLID